MTRLLLPAILLSALALRLYGIDWDEGGFFHPDERFIIQFKLPELRFPWPPDPALLLDPARSPWNPRWFAYGTFPIYLLKWLEQVAEAVDPSFTLNQVRFLGRGLSALTDTGSVLLVYLIGARLYGRQTGLLAAALMALTVLHIQLSHFSTFDVQLTFWVLLALYGAARLKDRCDAPSAVLTGLALGLGLATKVSILPLAIPVGTAFLLYLFGRGEPSGMHGAKLRQGPEGPSGETPRSAPGRLERSIGAAILTASVALLAFVLAQPYAVLDLQAFLRDTREQSEMALRVRDLPFTRQYIDTAPYLYQVQQSVTWAMGLPLGVVAWLGVGASFWWAWRRGNRGDVLLLSWILPYFLFTGAFPVKFLRYLLPITPLLVLLGARLLLEVRLPKPEVRPALVGVLLLATGLYALAFLNIYRDPHPAVEMSRWIRENVPQGQLILKEHWEEGVSRLEAYRVEELKLYEPDTAVKLAELGAQLESADYILLFSNRLYGTISRLPERYPMSREYYRLLFSGDLGYELAHVTQAYPSILGVTLQDDTFSRPDLPRPRGLSPPGPGPVLNLGYADESFTAYDHPRVMLFKRVRSVTAAEVMAGLAPALPSVDPLASGALMMSPDLAAAQYAGGTWSDLFQTETLGNRVPVLIWLLVVQAAALFTFPIARLVFSSFPDRGYLLSKALGLLLLSNPVWLAASLRIAPFSPEAIGASLTGLGMVGGVLAWRTRAGLIQTLRSQRGLLLSLEALFLVAFLAFLLVRAANPDLWHPARGGEKPMDFAYLNAIIKSTYMPPYDPWFSGGYLNYYYYGQFMVATLIKLTGIVPAVAYNLAIPTLFAFLVANAFSVGAALASAGVAGTVGRGMLRLTSAGLHSRSRKDNQALPPPVERRRVRALAVGGATGVLGVAVLGNLDGGMQVVEVLQRAGAGGVASTIPGVAGLMAIATALLRAPVEPGILPGFDYWRSRGMGGMDPTFIDPVLRAPSISIVEFPFFTFLFADLHAHLIALPFALLALALSVQAALGLARTSLLRRILFLGLAGLTLGTLRWTNTWDYPTYLVVMAAGIVIGEMVLRRALPPALLHAGIQVAVVFALSLFLFRPLQESYELFFGGGLLPSPEVTPLALYLRIHGLFLFILTGFMLLELVRRFPRAGVFRAAAFAARRGVRPLRAWRLYRRLGTRPPHLVIALGGLAGATLLLLSLALLGLTTAAVLALLIALFAVLGVKELSQPSHRGPWYLMALVLAGSAAGLSLLVEVVKLDIPGEIQRMNTVFKIYLQVWLLYALSSAYALWYLLQRREGRPEGHGGEEDPDAGVSRGVRAAGEAPVRLPRSLRRAWLAGLVLLLAGTAAYPLLATPVRVADRFTPLPPALNGIEYMQAAVQRERDHPIELQWDHDAIRWFQENVEGSPVILEAVTPIYRWGSRFSINTGLPTVLGWDWHQSQQRWSYRAAIEARKNDVTALYSDPDPVRASALLTQYNVRYIVVGALERAFYPEAGLRKFDQMAAIGALGLAYQNQEVKVYKVPIDSRRRPS